MLAIFLKKICQKKISLDSKLVSEMTKSFYKENKKVSNQKIKKVLGSDFFTRLINRV